MTNERLPEFSGGLSDLMAERRTEHAERLGSILYEYKKENLLAAFCVFRSASKF